MARISAAINTNNPDVTPALQSDDVVRDQIDCQPHRCQDTTTKLEQDDAELGTAMQRLVRLHGLDAALAKASA